MCSIKMWLKATQDLQEMEKGRAHLEQALNHLRGVMKTDNKFLQELVADQFKPIQTAETKIAYLITLQREVVGNA